MQELTRKFFYEKCKKITLPQKEDYMGEYISLYNYTTLINGEDYRNLYIIDMTDDDTAKSIQNLLQKENDDFYYCYFSDMFYESSGNLRWENNVIFMTDEELKHYDPKIEGDFTYIRKRFVRESDLLKILNRQETLTHDDFQTPFEYEGENHNLSRFNVLFGENGSGKTRMIKEMSVQFNVPILNDGVDNYFQYDTDAIKRTFSEVNYDKLIENYRRLWNYSMSKSIDFQNISKHSFSSTELKFLMYAAKFSKFENSNSEILLLDDIGWNGLDSHKTLNAIEYLSDLSLSGKTVVCATLSPNVKSLMLRKTYKPNTILF